MCVCEFVIVCLHTSLVKTTKRHVCTLCLICLCVIVIEMRESETVFYRLCNFPLTLNNLGGSTLYCTLFSRFQIIYADGCCSNRC